MKLSKTEISALTKAHDADERSALVQGASEFILSTANRLPLDADGLGRWIKTASRYLNGLTVTHPDLAKSLPAVVSQLRIQIGVAEMRHEKLLKVPAKPAPPAPALTVAKPAPPVAPAKPSPTAVSIPAPDVAPPPMTEPAVVDLHPAKRVIANRAVQAQLKRYTDEIAAVHAAKRRYESQLAASPNVHSRHRVELKRRLQSLQERLINLIQEKSLLREQALKPQGGK